jgi:hypothetical protein
MSTVNVVNPALDNTVRIFDQFYNFDIQVPQNEYDVVNSYFISVFKSITAARNFTVTLFRVAQQTQVPVMTLLAQLQSQDALTVNTTLAYFLNGLRSPSTLLGVNSVLTPNYFTARNVLA